MHPADAGRDRGSSRRQGTANYHPAVETIVRRAADRADEELSLAIHNDVWPRHAVSMDEVDSFKRSAHAYADHVAFIDGELVASAFVAILPQRPGVGSALITVLEPRRGRGAGTALYREISAWCAAQGIDTIEAPVEADDVASLEYAGRRGFGEIERYGRMVLELAELDLPAATPPAGIEIVTWAQRPDLARGIYDVAVEAYADVPGGEDEEMEPYEDWLAHDMQGSGDLPEATFVAIVGPEVVGYAKFSLTAAQPSVAFHDMTGVKRSWRGRGVAGALKHAQLAWAKQQGYERLVTGNEERNEPILRLNRRLGYREAPGRVLMRGPLLQD
jgi:GNAT superfamily N-acetyltransferase